MMGTPRFLLEQAVPPLASGRTEFVPHKIQDMGAPVSGVMEGENVIQPVPENDDEAWQNVVIVNFNRDNRQVNVNANDRSNDNSDYSVPSLRESSSRSHLQQVGLRIIQSISSIRRASCRFPVVWIPFVGIERLKCTYSLLRV